MSDLTGLRFERWTVIKFDRINNIGKRMWVCRCDCGTEKSAVGSNLVNGKSKSCGCLRNEKSGQRSAVSMLKHGHSRTGLLSPEYRSWTAMRKRCRESGVNGFEYYGGLGISVCERWSEFENFLEDMGPKPTPKHQIDRIDPSGHYEPSNCRWSTPSENARNRRPKGTVFQCA